MEQQRSEVYGGAIVIRSITGRTTFHHHNVLIVSLVPYSLRGFIIILFDVPIFIGLTDCGGVTTLSHTI